MDQIYDALIKITEGDFSVRLEIDNYDDKLRSIAIAINMLAEEINELFHIKLLHEIELKKKVQNLEKDITFLQETEIKSIKLMKEVDSLLNELGRPAKYF